MLVKWNPPGTPYPPAQDGATLLVWPIPLLLPVPVGLYCHRNIDGEWLQELGYVAEAYNEVVAAPSVGWAWLLIPDPEQGR